MEVNENQKAINKVIWSREGDKIATGSSDGRVDVFALASDVWKPVNEDFLQFQRVISDAAVVVGK